MEFQKYTSGHKQRYQKYTPGNKTNTSFIGQITSKKHLLPLQKLFLSDPDLPFGTEKMTTYFYSLFLVTSCEKFVDELLV